MIPKYKIDTKDIRTCIKSRKKANYTHISIICKMKMNMGIYYKHEQSSRWVTRLNKVELSKN